MRMRGLKSLIKVFKDGINQDSVVYMNFFVFYEIQKNGMGWLLSKKYAL